MSISLPTRALAGLSCVAISLVGFASAASAEDASAVLTLGAVDVLTLPAGDGVRDTTALSITSDVATTVSVIVRDPGTSSVLETLLPVDLAAGVAGTVNVDVSGLSAGSLEIVATPTEGAAVVAPLTVGSGEPSDVSLSLSESSIFTWSAATPNATVATVSASDETGLNVPFTGTVNATVGGKSYAPAVASPTGDPATASILGSKLAPGAGSVTASISGPSATAYTDSAPLTVVQTAITGVTLKASVTTVFPAKDYYRDTVAFTLTPAMTTNSAFATTGTVKITRGGKTVKTWNITSAKTWTLTWDGKVGGKVVPGTYTITASVKGPEGTTRTAKTTVTVDSGKLATKTKTLTYSGAKAFAKFAAFDSSKNNACYSNYPRAGYVFCDGNTPAADADNYSVMSFASFTVPTYVQSAQKYGSTKAAATLYNVKRYSGGGDVYLETDKGTWHATTLASGTRALGTITMDSGAKKVYVTLGLLDYSQVSVGSVKVTYTYKVMTH